GAGHGGGGRVDCTNSRWGQAQFLEAHHGLGPTQRPAHYLAIPPLLFGEVVEQLAKAGCTKGARLIVEKPFGHDLDSARELNRILLANLDESAIFRIDHYLGKKPVPSTAKPS